MINTYEINGKEYLFVCDSRNTRHGFAHDCTLYIEKNYTPAGKNTCHYLNRTWEKFRYQSVMRGLVYDLIAAAESELLENFKLQAGYSRMTARRREEFAENIRDNQELKDLNALLQALA